MREAARVLRGGGGSPREAGLSPVAAGLVIGGECSGHWMRLHLLWEVEVVLVILEEPGGERRDAVVPFGNLPGARGKAWTELHPVVSGLGEGTLNSEAKGDVGTGCWCLILAEQAGISVHITWL